MRSRGVAWCGLVCSILWGCAPPAYVGDAARAPAREVASRPSPPMSTCAEGERGASGVTLECEGYAVFYGDVNAGVEPEAQRDRVDEALSRQHGEAYRVKRGMFEVGRESLPALRYELVEGRSERVKLEGAHVFQATGRGSRALMCAGAPGTSSECDRALDALALGGLPAALEPERVGSFLPRMFGEPVIVPAGCEGGAGEVRCGDATLTFEEVPGGEVPGFEAMYVDEVERELERVSGGEAAREEHECTLMGGPAECVSVVAGEGVVWVAVSGRAGARGVVTCVYSGGERRRNALPEVCSKLLNPL